MPEHLLVFWDLVMVSDDDGASSEPPDVRLSGASAEGLSPPPEICLGARRRINLAIKYVMPVATVMSLVGAVLASALSGYPGRSHLPAVAFDSGALFYVERAAVFFAAFVLISTLLTHGLKGHLATDISTTGLRWEMQAEQAFSHGESAITELEHRVDLLADDVGGEIANIKGLLADTASLAARTAAELRRNDEPELQS